MKQTFSKFPHKLIGLLLILLFAAACAPASTPGPSTQPVVQPTQPVMQPTQPMMQPTQPAAQPTQPAAQPTQAAVPATGSQTVNVTETEFMLDMPNSVSAGMVTFNVTNKGTIPHSLEIQGQGIDQKLSSLLQPGQSGTLQVNLKPGSYTVFCPVDDHKGSGMLVNLTVQ